MNDDADRLINGTAATCAWFGLLIVIVVVAVIGMLCGHGSTSAAVLATCTGIPAALVALGRKTKTSIILGITAALSAAAALLVRAGETVREIATKIDAETGLVLLN